MNVLDQEPWSWTLYGEGDRRVLTVLVGGVAQYDLSVELTPEERAGYDTQGVAGLKRLIADIQEHPSRYRARKVPDP
jgi:hypothetical protein